MLKNYFGTRNAVLLPPDAQARIDAKLKAAKTSVDLADYLGLRD